MEKHDVIAKQPLFDWVEGHFFINRFLIQERFNTSIYTDAEKAIAAESLNEMGLKTIFSNNGNSLLVTK